MKRQVFVIHGGDCFDSYEEYLEYLRNYEMKLENIGRRDWKSSIAPAFPEFDVYVPDMPNKKNARYAEWKIIFDKLVALMHDDVVLVGHSLGGIFLAKYLSENSIDKKIASLHLVAAPFDSAGAESLGDFTLAHDLGKISDQAPAVFFYFSSDDPVVDLSNRDKYKAQLPNAKFIDFSDRKHFNQETFPELVKNIT